MESSWEINKVHYNCFPVSFYLLRSLSFPLGKLLTLSNFLLLMLRGFSPENEMSLSAVLLVPTLHCFTTYLSLPCIELPFINFSLIKAN